MYSRRIDEVCKDDSGLDFDQYFYELIFFWESFGYGILHEPAKHNIYYPLVIDSKNIYMKMKEQLFCRW